MIIVRLLMLLLNAKKPSRLALITFNYIKTPPICFHLFGEHIVIIIAIIITIIRIS